MTLLFMEGWDNYSSLAELREANHLTYSTSYWTTSTGRFTGKALYQNSSNPTIEYRFTDSTTDTYYLGFAAKMDSFAGYYLVYTMYGTGSIRNCIYLNVNGTLEVRRGNTTILGTSTGAMSTNQWHYIVLKVKVNDTTGTVELWLDGIKEIDLTSQDTNPGTGTSINGIRLIGYFQQQYFDDLYVGDTAGSDMTDQVGEVAIEMLTPDADGNRNNFTRVGGGLNNYEAVDDGATTDGDTTYNHSATATDGELYGTGSITQTIDTVYAVQVQARLRKEDAGYRTVNTVCRSSTSETDGTATGVGSGYRVIHSHFENDPNGGGNWTETNVNACEVGIEIAS